MFKEIFNIENGIALSIAGTLATINTIIVEVLKNILPKSIPTKIVAVIRAIFVSIGYGFIFGSINLENFILGIFEGFLVAFISMFGFDTAKDIIKKLYKNNGGGE